MIYVDKGMHLKAQMETSRNYPSHNRYRKEESIYDELTQREASNLDMDIWSK